MKRLLAGLVAALLLASPALAQTPPAKSKPPAAQTIAPAKVDSGPRDPKKPRPLWAFLESDIAQDPAVRYGVLDNGMRYALLHNALPPGAVYVRLSMKFGSLEEQESEKGLAHFIEHMAFNGSKHVPEGDMVKILERLGLAFGADTNASTDQKFTTYQLDLPKGSEENVDESLFLMREVASELTFDPGAIDRERGVVLSEWRRGDNFQRRRGEQELGFLVPGSYAANRMPIGEAPVIEKATHDQLASLYDRYYRPERATLVIVGDIDVDAVEAKIKVKFADWKGRGEPGADPDQTYKLAKREPAASVFVRKEGGDALEVYSLAPFTDLPDTAANRREANLLNMGIGAVQRRLQPMTNSEDPPFRSAGLSSGDILEAADSASGSVVVTPDKWKPGLETLEQEWRRALLYGFTKDEIDLQVQALRTGQQNQAKREATRTTGELMGQLLSAIQNDTVFATPSSGLKRFEGWAPQVTPEAVHAIFKKWMTVGTPLFFMSSSVERPGVEKEIVETWKESTLVEVKPPTAKSAQKFAYTSFGKPGKVVKDARIEDIDTREVTFENNVRLNLKKTSFQKDVVQVSLRVGAGALDLPAEPFGLQQLMGAYSQGGLEKHSADDLRTILAGKQVSTRFSAGSASFGGTYVTTPQDLELQLDVAAAFLTHPGYRPEAERRWRQSIELSWPRLDANANVVWEAKGRRILASGDKRFGTDKDDGEVKRTFAELKKVVTPILAKAPIEIAVVGDIDEQAVIDLVAKTFGALPKRDAAPPRTKSDRAVTFRQDKTPILLTHAGEPNQALANVYWPVDIDPDEDVQAARVLAMMTSIMRLKVIAEVREALGATYSPSAGASLSSIF
ncbi:MAG TPA: insulinase family protein, partial [Hyphomonadaceae bacterium]|nr:insulinase family protein [Hyphomonadaceae bacterium]